ncbi:MAG: L-aspartate oxidase [Acidimicrobiaceae bacterium]
MTTPDDSPAGDLDLLVLGSGVAGLSAAVQAASVLGLRVGVLTKGELSQSATSWAQGGVAAAIGGDPDSADLHLADTLAAGAGLCDADAVRVLVDEGPGRVNDLIALGAVFDTDPAGVLALAREGGHSVPRVVHAGGAATGAEIERALVEAVRTTAVSVLEGWFAADLIVSGGRCRGVVALDPSGRPHPVRAPHILLASGGAGQLYSVTTNPAQATGDGVAMALRAGVAVADVEFVQFHPTALHHPQMPRPLLSEALRGHGALLRDARGDRFVEELAPRDVVSRAMAIRMREQGADHLWLDATPLASFEERFPTIAVALGRAGLDPAVDWLPIAPAAHYLVGGVLTDLDGASALPGLWAAGEVACTGVHGANRLASNSLLEGMVFGARVVEAIAAGGHRRSPSGALRCLDDGTATQLTLPEQFSVALPTSAAGDVTKHHVEPAKARETLQAAMTSGAGVARDARSLAETDRDLRAAAATIDPGNRSREANECRNLLAIGSALVLAASVRQETRGCHTRTDFPAIRPDLAHRLVIA